MKLIWMFIFMALPVAGLAYVLWHIWQMLPFANAWRWAVTGAALAAFAVMITNFMGTLEHVPLNFATCLYEVGDSFIFILLYLVMLFLVFDIASLIHLIPRAWLHSNGWASAATAVLMTAIFAWGNYNYNHKVCQPLHIATEKRLLPDSTGKKSVRMVLLSDLHLGYHNRRKEFARWVDIINNEHPDMILIGGDIIDISVRPLAEERVAEEFRRLNAPVFACLGNHEYYSGEPRAQHFYNEAGITLLRDSVANVGGISIIGRDDRTNIHRLPLRKIMKNVPKGNFTILLDHQPYHLEQAEREEIDFQFSGHTHRGQVWPASWITDALYECSFGSLRKGGTEYYVSSGMGIWGGKFRIGTRSEYVVLTVEEKQEINDQRS